MNLYKISQTVNGGYDTFSDAVVAACDEEHAKYMHPCANEKINWYKEQDLKSYTWCHPKDVRVELIGTAIEGTQEGVICASFHAG